MAHPLLPSLNEHSNIAINQSGQWITGLQNTLSGLVDSLKVGTNKKTDISSIPDIWARPILVRSILNDVTHPQHKRYVGEWRGLLAILAFRRTRGFKQIKLMSVEIPTIDALRDNDPEFLKVLARSMPVDYLKMQNDETIKGKAGVQAKVQLLVYDDRPIGIFWPSILICPALDLELAIDALPAHDIAWWNYDGIKDPIEYLSKEENNSLHQWLQNIIDDDSIFGNEELFRLLCSFRDDIKRGLRSDFGDTTPYKASSSGLGITGLCSVVDSPLEGILDAIFLTKSHVVLRSCRGKENLKNMLIVASDLDQQWHVSDSEIIIGGFVNASAYLHKGTGMIADHKRLGDIDLSTYNAEIHMADEFFTDKIAVCAPFEYNVFPNVMGNRIYHYGQVKANIILPIRKTLLDYLEPEYIAQHTHIEIEGEDITVTLDLPVSGMEGRRNIITAKKTYRALSEAERAENVNEEILLYDSIPLVQVWPNIRTNNPEDWKLYEVYVDPGAMEVFNTIPIFPTESSESIIRPGTNAEIYKGTSFPEAFVCEHITKTWFSQDGRSEITEEVGLLLLDQRKLNVISPQNFVCKIGVDFGTTNTTAYMKMENEEPMPIRFKNHKYHVTYTAGSEKLTEIDLGSLRRYFIPEEEQPSKDQYSIKTMYHANMEKNEASPLFSGNIYYLENSSNFDDDHKIIGNIKTTDMKWDDVNGRLYMEGFLMQLALQCMIEAAVLGAGRIEWFYSYPKAFSIKQQADYLKTWSKIYNETIKKTCPRLIGSGKPARLSESESVAEYFKKELQAATDRGIVCMDIGGGSTDIAVWQGSEDTLRNQTSIRFAGRDILNNFLWNYKEKSPTILSKLKNDNAAFSKMLKNLTEEKSRPKFDLKIEALLRYYENDIFKVLPSREADHEVGRLIRDISFALSGLFFYCGMLIGHLRVTGQYDKSRLLPNCYVGGNASKLLHWAAGGDFTTNIIIAEIFKRCWVEGVKTIDTDFTQEKGLKFNINISKHPKQEVARGLVIDNDMSEQSLNFDIDANSDISLFAGEVFMVNNEIKSNLIEASDLLSGVRIHDERPEVFETFITLFNRIMKPMGFATVELDSEDMATICTNVNQTLSNIRKKANGSKESVNLEPIFILVLKEACSYLSEYKVND